ncbi:ABC-type phosphate/phosphonate transport system, substrate-binding protein [Variovorax sp. OK605]|jgi:phosphonate transport system substrate-binding protein|uniref:phosphate/phosphite/phosphonate ABC transporter substrate-binding protein n=1 Tax=unclassified Variovorax TaxID=663243 RepID=UPI0008BC51AB|nr:MULTISPECIES: PhnD/SsuA/transferrin family substrate-binding protein [unclassified Variovorax]SEJ55158.1 ABC-type phosphate/phosphonate transport system, substrate-binding protein [Variovorax sp. OK202]SFC59167.1 ABC-type phosphate/phosphonate transport system, substrate-binding protein [Variovorax sp. OK212]SFP24374.1 ABC-type phosphate/phosphonate transport system, substrate-binding protein [Variovorax sp. OK605]
MTRRTLHPSLRATTRGVAGLLMAGCASAHALVIGVSEGVSYDVPDAQITARFEPIAELLAKALKQPVTIKVLNTYNGARSALQQQQVDFAFVHPSHVALGAIKGGQYRAFAWTTGYTDYKVSFLCKEQQPISDWKSVAGKQLVMPDADSITAVITRAMLREQGLQDAGAVKVTNTRFQEAVPFYVQNGFAAYGATAAASVVKTWKDGGGKVCAESRAVPVKQWLASRKLDAATVNTARDALLSLAQTDAGKRALATSTYVGFVAPSADIESSLMRWLGI